MADFILFFLGLVSALFISRQIPGLIKFFPRSMVFRSIKKLTSELKNINVHWRDQ